MATRWGIVSAGKISNDFVSALKLLPPEEHQVVAVAARNLESAQNFAKKYDIPRAYGSYEELSKDKQIDIAYIGAIHPMHLPVCKLFLNAGYPVLCEKPITMNAGQLRELIKLAKEKGLFLMEGFWSRCFPIYDDLKKELSSGCIGEPQHVIASFGHNVVGNCPRLERKDIGGGCLIDMGVYPLQFAQMVFNYEMPKKIIATGLLNEQSGVDEMVSVTLEYSNHRLAVINCCLTSTLDQRAVICGNKNTKQENVITLENFWAPTTMVTPHKTYNRPLPESTCHFNFVNSAGLVYEAQSARECLLKGLKENPLIPLEQSLQLQEILDEIRRQIGLVYDTDK